MSRGGKRILVAAGLDPSGRAGLLADVATIKAMNALPVAVATALTAQGAKSFTVDAVSPRTLTAQVKALRELGPIDAVKLGMIPNRGVLRALWSALPARVPVIVDPVVRTSKGQRLSSLTRQDYLGLAGPNVIVTPNLAEAAWLLGTRSAPASAEEALDFARALIALGFGAVIVKGGHLDGVKVDVVVDARMRSTLLRGAPLVRSPLHRGTGCRYASALAVGVARSGSLDTASRTAKRVVEKFLQAPILGHV